MWILNLSNMTWPKFENSLQAVAWVDTREELEAFVERERVENYQDDGFSKNFRKGGPLEMFNPISLVDPEFFYGCPHYETHGTREEVVQRSIESFEQKFDAFQNSLHDARATGGG